MKIAVIVSEYRLRGGFPRYGAQIASSLSALGHDVTVITRRATPDERDRDIKFEKYSTISWPNLLHMATEPWTITKVAREAAPKHDVVITVGMPSLAPTVLFGPGTHRGWYKLSTDPLPILGLRRWYEKVRPFHKVVMFWEKRMLKGRHPRLVIVASEIYLKEYTDLFGFPREKIALVPHATESAFRFDEDIRGKVRAELGLEDKEPVLLSVARRGRQKGLDVLIKALELLPKDRPWRAAFVGEASEAQWMRRATERLRDEGRVMLLGSVAPDSVRDFYCAADLLVFPSRWDSWGLAVTEALACGLPVVCSRRIGAAVAVKDGENGTLIDNNNDPVEIKDRIMEIMPRLREFERGAVAASVEWLSEEAVARRLESVLEGLVSKDVVPSGPSDRR